MGYSNCRDLVRVYPELDLSCLPSSSMDMGKFIIKLVVDPSPHQDMRSDSSHQPCCEALSRVKDPPSGFEIARSQSSIAKPASLEDKGNQSIEMESWSDSGDQQPTKTFIIDSEAKDYPLQEFCFALF